MTTDSFAEPVRNAMWQLLSSRYRTSRTDRQADAESADDRPFWPDFTFETVSIAGREQSADIQVTFYETIRPETLLGFRIDLDKAASSWSERVGGRDPSRYPEMFAAELVWFMVCYIGVADLDPGLPGDRDGPRWINQGTEVFGKLKNNPNMNTFDSHH